MSHIVRGVVFERGGEWMTTRDYWIKLGKASIQMAYLATSVSSKHESAALNLARCARLGEIVLANENLKELSSSGLAHQVLKNTGLCYVCSSVRAWCSSA